MKQKTVEDIEDEIKSVSRKRDITIVEAQKYQDQLVALAEQLYEIDPQYIKVECFRCGGVGYLKGEDDKKHICELCGGKEYTWMKIYDGNKK